jgi:hypothetical protein
MSRLRAQERTPRYGTTDLTLPESHVEFRQKAVLSLTLDIELHNGKILQELGKETGNLRIRKVRLGFINK